MHILHVHASTSMKVEYFGLNVNDSEEESRLRGAGTKRYHDVLGPTLILFT